MVWVKRLLPLVVIAVGYFGYTLWHDWYTSSRAEELDRTALITARVWVGTARYAGDQDRFLTWRDSLLEAQGITVEEAEEFLERYQREEEQFLEFAQRVKTYVDSLSKLEDSLRTARFREADTAVTGDTIMPGETK
ncbi:hypothetical protein GF377_02460 [candidate division GN15 bacterium]|nr:hypothetical protein [candidate division GN15 bacterium]